VSSVFELRPRVRRDNVALYHDYLCPWCWVGFLQAEALEAEFGIELEWIGAELYPPDLDGPPSNPGPMPPRDPNREKDRFDLFCDDEKVAFPDGASVGLDPDALEESIRSERHAEAILPFDDPAYAAGIRNVPTFVFGANEQLAEANLDDLRRAAERFLIRRERLRPETL